MGKIGENMLKRSVLKQIQTKREEVVTGAGVGTDCSFFVCEEGMGSLAAINSFEIKDQQDVSWAIISCINNVAAAGGEPVGIQVAFLWQKDVTKQLIKEYMAKAAEACQCMNVQLMGGDNKITSSTSSVFLTVSVIGKKEVKLHKGFNQYKGNEDIVITKWIGLMGTAVMAKREEAVLKKRLPAYMVEDAKKFCEYLSVLPESRIGMKCKVKGMHDVSRKGVFAALWELAEGDARGLRVELKSIPIRQETVEICEILEVNPYELYGAGSLLMVTENGNNLVYELKKAGIQASVIGKLTEDKAKIIVNGEETRYLDRP